MIADAISEGLHFGIKTHKDFVPFTIKFMAMAIPGIILGHYLDQSILWLQLHKYAGDMPVVYTILQLLSWVVLYYLLVKYANGFAIELQDSIAGIFFVTLFFIVQTNFVSNLQHVLGVIDKEI
jgi:hypothetical protein